MSDLHKEKIICLENYMMRDCMMRRKYKEKTI